MKATSSCDDKPKSVIRKKHHFLMTDLGLSNGYFCIVEQDDTFKFLIDYLKRRPDIPIDYHVSVGIH